MGYGTDGLTFNTLRDGNVARLPEFKNKHGKPAHSEPDGSDWSPAQWLQAVIGELGEYANFRKKFERGDITEEEFTRHAASEIADTVTYLDILAFRLGIDLGRAVMNKWNFISHRVGCDITIDAEGWHRKPQIFCHVEFAEQYKCACLVLNGTEDPEDVIEQAEFTGATYEEDGTVYCVRFPGRPQELYTRNSLTGSLAARKTTK